MIILAGLIFEAGDFIEVLLGTLLFHLVFLLDQRYTVQSLREL